MSAIPTFGPGETNPYFILTDAFNAGRLRALVSSGQACVHYRMAMVSKDGDWILREDEETFDRVLRVLAERGARYRIGAPLALPWMAGGWSSHFEWIEDGLRLRTDFVTRPPRMSPERLAVLWEEAGDLPAPVLPPTDLIALKRTQRMKDYPFIGSLARMLPDPADRLRHSRSAAEISGLIGEHPELAAELSRERPLLAKADADVETLESELDAEMRAAMRADAARMRRYAAALEPWAAWMRNHRDTWEELPLPEAHQNLVEAAKGVLPAEVDDD